MQPIETRGLNGLHQTNSLSGMLQTTKNIFHRARYIAFRRRAPVRNATPCNSERCFNNSGPMLSGYSLMGLKPELEARSNRVNGLKVSILYAPEVHGLFSAQSKACLDRDLAGSLPARQPSQPQALEIGRLGALPAPGSFAQAPSKQPLLAAAEAGRPDEVRSPLLQSEQRRCCYKLQRGLHLRPGSNGSPPLLPPAPYPAPAPAPAPSRAMAPCASASALALSSSTRVCSRLNCSLNPPSAIG